MTRDELILRTRQLIAEGERLDAQPSLNSLQTWLQLSDDLLATAWGTMDRYHLSWLMVGKPKAIVRGRSLTPVEEAAYVRDVAAQKTAALRMSLDAVERQAMPFRGETLQPGARRGPGEVPTARGAPGAGRGSEDERPRPAAEPGPGDEAVADRDAHHARASRRAIPLDPEMQRRLDEARRAAAKHADGTHGEPRAPRPERLER